MTKPAIASKDSGVEAAAWSSLCCLGGREPLQVPCGKVCISSKAAGVYTVASDRSAFIEC